jgi:hypothetical protein
MSLFRLNNKRGPSQSNRPSSDRLSELEAITDRAIASVKRLESRVNDTEGRLDSQEQWNTECESAVKKNNAPAVPQVACSSCRNVYPNYPAYWPGGFHGSTEPICAYCKPEREYQLLPPNRRDNG